MRHSTPLLIAVCIAGAPCGALGNQIYVATFTGTMTDVSEASPIDGLEVGQQFTFRIRTVVTPEELFPGNVRYELISSSLTFDDGTPDGLTVPTSGYGSLGITYEQVPFVGYAIGGDHYLSASDMLVSASLWDPEAPYAASGTDLPLTLDVHAFDPEYRSFSIAPVNEDIGVVGTIEGFSARFIPAPGAATLFIAPLAPMLPRRRRPSI